MSQISLPTRYFLSELPDFSQLGPGDMGEMPRPAQFGRWVRVDQVDLSTLPPVKRYECLRTEETMVIDGRLDEAAWSQARWSEPFGMIHDGSATPYETRVAMLWNDDYLFVGYRVEDPDIRAVMTGFNDHVYLLDEDVEFFFAGEGYYYELGLNALNNTYQIRWTWIERLVQEQRYAELESLFKTPDYLYYLAREGESIGRHADLSYRMPGLQHAVHVDGTLNCPAIRDRGWSVELAIPWTGLAQIAGADTVPPQAGDTLKMTAYRAHHDRKARSMKGWTWSVMGNNNIHIPERWNEIVFSDTVVGVETAQAHRTPTLQPI